MDKIDWKKRAETLVKDNIELITDNASLKVENKELKEQLALTGVVQAKPEGFYCEDEQGRIAEETGDKIEKCGKQCYYCKQ